MIKDIVHNPRYNSYTEKDFKNITVMNILAKEWVDNAHNSYFSTRITLYYKGGKEETIYIPLMYGYDNAYEEVSAIILGERPWIIRAKYGFVLIQNKVRACTKKEVEAWGHE